MRRVGISARAVRALLRNDLRKLSRDPVLLTALLVPIVLAVLLRVGLPALEAAVHEWFDLAVHRSTIVAGALSLSAMLGGWIVGFMLLEERAERMIPAIAVTPLTRRGFVVWRLLAPVVIALLGGLIVLALGRGDAIALDRALVGCMLMAPSAPLFSLALVSVADNEVEGLALGKLAGLAFMLPLVTLYLEGPWIWLAGVLPPFWAIRWLAGGSWWTVLVGLGTSACWAHVLLRRLARRID
jgi:fluoroquinolone transport system permease protein